MQDKVQCAFVASGNMGDERSTEPLIKNKAQTRSSTRQGNHCQQECIPVGCVPSAAGGVSAPVHAGICLPSGVSAPVHAGICLPRGGCLPQCMLGYAPCEQND